MRLIPDELASVGLVHQARRDHTSRAADDVLGDEEVADLDRDLGRLNYTALTELRLLALGKNALM
jgi:hypothetical protein